MLVIGNGESRKKININNILDEKIGCNALHRDYIVDHLICVDKKMVQEALPTPNKIYTRPEWIDKFRSYENVHLVPELPYKGKTRPDEPFQWGSGPYAVLLGALLEDYVSMIGFDLYSDTATVNNVYKGTQNYDADNKRPVDPSYWIHQIGKVFECFPKTEFTIYQKDTWKMPETWIRENVFLDSISKIS